MYKKICVIGLGYIGLPTATIFAENNLKVVGVDKEQSIVDCINSGKIHIEEPGLDQLVEKVVANGNLKASLLAEAADAFIICVPTPNNDDEYKSCDINYVLEATRSIIPFLKEGNLVVIESTVAPRTTEDYVKPILEAAGFVVGKNIYLAHCPERVLPGKMIYEIVNNNRIIGGVTSDCTKKAVSLYKAFVKGEITKTEAKTAEMSKVMENTFRDINIAIANELAKICDRLDINVLDVIEMANKHPRVNILKPGTGVGGHCLAVDPYYVYAKVPDLAKLIKTARDTNNSMPEYVANKVEKLLNGDKTKIIAILGATFKANVDDLRESPNIKIANILIKNGYTVRIHDPHVKDDNYVSFEEVLNKADILLHLVAHDEFKNMDFDYIAKAMREPLVFDPTGSLVITNSSIKLINYGNIWEYDK